MKYITLSFCMMIMLSPFILLSQKTFVSIGAEIGLPGSHVSMINTMGTGFGASARIESSWGKHISGMASLGYLGFGETNPYSSEPSTTVKVHAFVIQPGIKYYLLKKQERPKGFFVSIEFGLMYTKTNIDYENHPNYTSKEAGISCAPGIGYQLGKVETGFRLQYNLSETGYNVYYYNFRIAYAFLKGKAGNK